jgi:DNA repair protein RecN (Recombination protein N)
MLARLSIRDIVLIDRLDIDFGSGLAVLTGETGAGKSILLDAFALALGARGDVALVRDGAEQGQVIAAFEIGQDHPARTLLADNGLSGEDELILRRVQFADGRTRAFVNDQPVSVQVLRALGVALVEIHGQHDERAFVEAAAHRGLLDAYGGIEGEAAAVAALWAQWRECEAAVQSHRADVERAGREAEWLRHAVEELGRLAPQPGDESALAERRAAMMQAEKVADDLRSTHDSLAGPNSPVSPLAGAVRRLERRAAQAQTLVEPVTKAIDAALTALDEARLQLEHALQLANYDPQELEKIEERLFALRAAGRKYNAPVDELAALARRYESDLGLIDAGA